MLKIALSGANGKMGKAILAAAKPDPEVTIPVKLIKSDQKINLLEELKAIDVCIDFSSPAGSENYFEISGHSKIYVSKSLSLYALRRIYDKQSALTGIKAP